jgi:hypothetical protein
MLIYRMENGRPRDIGWNELDDRKISYQANMTNANKLVFFAR